ncbi:MAG: hypothetical protein ING22_04380 [Burkholderiales bacterium]|nr:hypothetical protein [Burkholderiales bacterium]
MSENSNLCPPWIDLNPYLAKTGGASAFTLRRAGTKKVSIGPYAQRLADIRQNIGLSLENFAHMLEISNARLATYVYGRHDFQPDKHHEHEEIMRRAEDLAANYKDLVTEYKKNDRYTIQQWLKKWARQIGVKPDDYNEIAMVARVHVSTVWRWARGDLVPPPHHLRIYIYNFDETEKKLKAQTPSARVRAQTPVSLNYNKQNNTNTLVVKTKTGKQTAPKSSSSLSVNSEVASSLIDALCDAARAKGHEKRDMQNALGFKNYDSLQNFLNGKTRPENLPAERLQTFAKYLGVPLIQVYVWAGMLNQNSFVQPAQMDYKICGNSVQATLLRYASFGIFMPQDKKSWTQCPPFVRKILTGIFEKESGLDLSGLDPLS